MYAKQLCFDRPLTTEPFMTTSKYGKYKYSNLPLYLRKSLSFFEKVENFREESLKFFCQIFEEN